MAERRTITVDIGEDYISTRFFPPLPETSTFEAISSALSFREVQHPKGSSAISGVVYDMGDPRFMRDTLGKMKEELEQGTGYEFAADIEQLIGTAP